MKAGFSGLDGMILGMLQMLELVLGGFFSKKSCEFYHLVPLEYTVNTIFIPF
jgi:hypothetical protein